MSDKNSLERPSVMDVGPCHKNALSKKCDVFDFITKCFVCTVTIASSQAGFLEGACLITSYGNDSLRHDAFSSSLDTCSCIGGAAIHGDFDVVPQTST